MAAAEIVGKANPEKMGRGQIQRREGKSKKREEVFGKANLGNREKKKKEEQRSFAESFEEKSIS